jgi:hypothetical protein
MREFKPIIIDHISLISTEYDSDMYQKSLRMKNLMKAIRVKRTRINKIKNILCQKDQNCE